MWAVNTTLHNEDGHVSCILWSDMEQNKYTDPGKSIKKNKKLTSVVF